MVHILPQRGTKFDHVISARYQRESNLRREGSGKVNFHYKTRGTSDKGVHYPTLVGPLRRGRALEAEDRVTDRTGRITP